MSLTQPTNSRVLLLHWPEPIKLQSNQNPTPQDQDALFARDTEEQDSPEVKRAFELCLAVNVVQQLPRRPIVGSAIT